MLWYKKEDHGLYNESVPIKNLCVPYNLFMKLRKSLESAIPNLQAINRT